MKKWALKDENVMNLDFNAGHYETLMCVLSTILFTQGLNNDILTHDDPIRILSKIVLDFTIRIFTFSQL